MVNKVLKAGFEANTFTRCLLLLLLLISLLLPSAIFAKEIGSDDLFKKNEGTIVNSAASTISTPINSNDNKNPVGAYIGHLKEIEDTPQGTSQSVDINNIKHDTGGVNVGAAAETVAPINGSYFAHDVTDINNSKNLKDTKDLKNIEDQQEPQELHDLKTPPSLENVVDVKNDAKTVLWDEKANDMVDAEHKIEGNMKNGTSKNNNNSKKIKKTKENGNENTIIHQNTPKTVSDSNNGIKEISFADNEQVKVVLSNRDINRVLVKNDKILSVNGPTGLYTAKNDAAGSAYISLYGLSGENIFTVFISTMKGHNFSLLITPRLVSGRTVILEPTTPSLLTARFEETESYQKVLVTLISGMINNEDLGDYAYSKAKTVQENQENRKTDFYGIADIKPIASYSGSHLLGVISEIKNKSRKPITLKPSYFYRPGVRAVALSHQTISPEATGLLYQVISAE